MLSGEELKQSLAKKKITNSLNTFLNKALESQVKPKVDKTDDYFEE